MRQPRSTKNRATVLSSCDEDDQKATSNSARESRSSQKPIYSFFNAATQRQRPRPSQDPVKHEDDIIQDDELDDEPTTAAPPLSLRKRHRPAASDAEDAAPSGSQKFLKTSVGQRLPAPVPPEHQRPWVDKYGPVNLDELAVHKRKVAHVRAWLANVFDAREPKRLLVLKGPAGSAKTTTLNLLSKDVAFEINEWKNPLGSDSFSDTFVSLSSQFDDFMGRTKFGSLDFAANEDATSNKTRVHVASRQVVLIEDFPNTFARSSAALQSFRSAIEQYLSASVPSVASMFTRPPDTPPPTPIVMIISETLLSTNTAAADSFTAHRLLGPEIINHPGTSVIEFNPIAPTILTKALELVVAKEARKSGRKTTPGPQVIKRLSEIGDVRSAISTLEFLCLRGDDDGNWGSRITFKAPKKGAREKPMTKMEQESLALVTQRESTLGIFHAVGKVVYNKREESSKDSNLVQPPSHLPEYRRPKASEVDVDTLIDELGTDIQTFIAALHENYVLSCSSGSEEDTLDSINGCIDALSDADILSPDRFSTVGYTRRTFQTSGVDSLRQDEMSFHSAVRGLLFNLPHPVKRSTPPSGLVRGKGSASIRDAHRLFYPTSLRIWRLQEEIEGLLDVSVRRAQMDGTSCTEASAQMPKRGTVESWSNRPSPLDPGTSNNSASSEQESTQPSLGTCRSLKHEMLLERLPYSAMMLRSGAAAATTATRLVRGLEKITSFSGVGISAEDGTADEDVLPEPPAAPGPSTRSAVSARKSRLGGGGAGASGTSAGTGGATLRDDHVGEILIGAGSERGLANLVLSDDDIEDDDD